MERRGGPHRDPHVRTGRGTPGPGPEHQYWTPHYGGPVQNLENRYSAPLDQQQAPSRRGYDYRAYAPWDYGATYTYQDYYNADHHASWWPQDSWGAQPNSCREREERASKDTPESLEASAASGLSCSSYELCQYMQVDSGEWHGHTCPTCPAAPLKFSSPHALASFGPAGQLVRVMPGRWAQDHQSHVEIHSLEVILSETQEQQEMRNFPGPLTREGLHKTDAIDFARQRALACSKDEDGQDRSGAALLWNILVLLCRQNGQMVGCDVAELLMAGSRSDGSVAPADVELIDFSEDNVAQVPPSLGDDLLTGSWSAAVSKKSLHGYTRLLLAGRKKEALESAMGGGLWGHALFLASKMDARSYTAVLDRFTGQVSAADPLHTLFQLLSGRIPAVATCFGGLNRANWRPHLAVMLSNETGDPTLRRRAVVAMGDTLASRGLLHAAHVCYLTSGVPFGAFGETTARMVLLGRSHKDTFRRFASDAAIHRTEIYEYCQTLGAKHFSIPSFQVFKFLYATRLLDFGLASPAFHYCELVGRSLLTQPGGFRVLTEELIKLAERLTHTEGPVSAEPRWLTELRSRLHPLLKEGSDRTQVQHPPEGSDRTQVQHPPEGSDRTEVQHPPEGSDRTQVQHPPGGSDRTQVQHPPEGSDRTEVQHPPEGSDRTEVQHPQDEQNVSEFSEPDTGAGAEPPDGSRTTAGHALGQKSWNVGGAQGWTPSPHTDPASVWDPQNSLGAGVAHISPRGSGPSLSAQPLPSGAMPVSNGSPANEQTEQLASQSTKSGWFRGWFKSRTPDLQE
ncbi:protein transport protein Sec16B [Nerophis ophidion]|uniref:protein transport protein Sec16B n=1 Tax=Nerophis ophidion TaxID=159077 RepID=UPI002ADF7B47|nr:protein transport protein Sec16B [Nerophis ophidion]